MASPIRPIEHSPQELMEMRNIYLQRIRTEEENRSERKKNHPDSDLSQHDNAVLDAKLNYLRFLRGNLLVEEEQEFLALPINEDARDVWKEEGNKPVTVE